MLKCQILSWQIDKHSRNSVLILYKNHARGKETNFPALTKNLLELYIFGEGSLYDDHLFI